MAKSTKVRFSGVGVYANEFILARVQTLSTDVDLSEEEIRELTNAEIVEFAAQTPAVTITIETNEYGSCRNLRSVASVTGTPNVTVNTFDGSSVDIGVAVEEDNVLKRTAIMNDCFLSSISWNYDVGGIATESYTLETDNRIWYLNTHRQAYSYNGINFANDGELTATSTVINLTWAAFNNIYEPIKQYVDGVTVTGTLTAATFDSGDKTKISWASETAVASGSRYRTVIAQTGSTSTTIPDSPGGTAIGGVTRGMLDIYLITGAGGATGGVPSVMDDFGSEGETNFLRLQTCAIDADLSREVLNELGRFRAYDRSLTFPVPVNLTFSMNDSDLEEWATLQTIDWGSDGSGIGNNLTIDSFTKTAALQIRVFDAKDTEATRNLKKSITVSGVQVTTESQSVDVGGNATHDFGAKASNFLVSGVGDPEDNTS